MSLSKRARNAQIWGGAVLRGGPKQSKSDCNHSWVGTTVQAAPARLASQGGGMAAKRYRTDPLAEEDRSTATHYNSGLTDEDRAALASSAKIAGWEERAAIAAYHKERERPQRPATLSPLDVLSAGHRLVAALDADDPSWSDDIKGDDDPVNVALMALAHAVRASRGGDR
jgi:hypothetical protein